MTEDVGTTRRKVLTPAQRLAMFERHNGICCICGKKITARHKWIDEHLIPLGLGGTNDPSNRGPAHDFCADAKTHGKDGDLARIAKAKRVKMRHLGIRRRKGPPIPGSKDSPWKRKLDGTLVRRTK